MGTKNAFYVRAENQKLTAALQKSFPAATLETGNDFTSAVLAENALNPPKAELAKLSVDFNTDVIWLGFQSAADAFIFYHWRNGALARSLVYGCHKRERTWEEVSGRPEPWELEGLFAAKELKFLVEAIADNEDQKREFERIWRNRELVPGRNQPMVRSEAMAWVVARHYQLPGWGSPGRPVQKLPPSPKPGSASKGPAPPPVPTRSKAFQVRAYLVPRYLWTSASIEVYLDGRCVLTASGQTKLAGTYASAFNDGGREHLAELKWGKAQQHQFPCELWVEGKKVMESRVPLENWWLGYTPAAIIFLIMIGITFAGVHYLISK